MKTTKWFGALCLLAGMLPRMAGANFIYSAVAIDIGGGVHSLRTEVSSGAASTKVKTRATGLSETLDVDVAPSGTIVLPSIGGTVSFLDQPGLSITTLSSFPAAGAARITPDGTTAWVSNSNGRDVWVFDVAGEQLVTQFTVPNWWGYTGGIRFIAFSPDGRTAYLSMYYPGILLVVDTQTYATSWVDGLFGPVEASPDGLWIYAFGGQRVFVLDAATRAIVASYDFGDNGGLGNPVWNATLSRDGATLYAIDNLGLTAIDTAALRAGLPDPTTARLPAWGLYDVAVSADGSLLYVASEYAPLTLRDARSFALLETVAAVPGARRVVAAP